MITWWWYRRRVVLLAAVLYVVLCGVLMYLGATERLQGPKGVEMPYNDCERSCVVGPGK